MASPLPFLKFQDMRPERAQVGVRDAPADLGIPPRTRRFPLSTTRMKRRDSAAVDVEACYASTSASSLASTFCVRISAALSVHCTFSLRFTRRR
jgi:hypothetical protein